MYFHDLWGPGQRGYDRAGWAGTCHDFLYAAPAGPGRVMIFFRGSGRAGTCHDFLFAAPARPGRVMIFSRGGRLEGIMS